STRNYTPSLHDALPIFEEPALDRLQREVPTQQPLLAPDLRHFSRRGQHAAQSPHRPGFENLSHAAGKARVAQACGQLDAENGVRSEEHTSELQSRENLV